MSTTAAATTPHDEPDPSVEAPYSRVRLTLGVVGRMWLWFLAACLAITLVPVVFGWHPFLIESGSMEPRIDVGDVILVSPYNGSAQDLVGHVVTVDDPGWDGRVKTHRVVSVDDDGMLVTKGDANRSDDTAHVPMSSVHGLGRLLVMWVGLPVIWIRTGQWLWLVLFLATIGLALWARMRDVEDEPVETDDDTDDGTGPGEPADPGLAAGHVSGTRRSSFDIAATRPSPLQRSSGKVVRRAGYAAVLAAALVLPTSTAAFSATTRNLANSWAASALSYTTEVNKLGPYLYWKFDDTSTSTGAAGRTEPDASGNGRTGQYNTNGGTTYFTKGVPGALTTDTPNRAVTLTNAASCVNTTSATLINGQSPVTVAIWFKVPSAYTNGGKLAGFEKPQTGVAVPSTGTYDRHLYLDGTGYVWFGVYNSGYVTVRSTATLKDNAWHMAVGSVGPAGTKLYIDGVLQATSSNTGAEATAGVWRAGCGNLGGWGGSWNGANSPTTDSGTAQNRPFLGSLDELSVFTNQLSNADVSLLYYAR